MLVVIDTNVLLVSISRKSRHHLVTNDKHFNVLKNLRFLPINIISANDFLDILEKV